MYSAALTWNRMHPAIFTKNLRQCQDEMELAPEYETDALLVELIKIQHLTEKIFRFNHREELAEPMPSLTPPVEADSGLYLISLKIEMESLQSSLPAWLENNCQF